MVEELQQINLVSVNCYKLTIKDWENKKQKILDLIDINREDKRIDTCYSDYFTYGNRPPYMVELVSIIADELQSFLDQTGMSFYPVQEWQMWSQRYIDSDYHGVHNHGFGHLSCILYVEFDSQHHQPTRFYSPIPDGFHGIIHNLQPPVNEGDLILFPSTIPHECPPSKCSIPRTVVAFNIPIGKND